MPPRYPLVDVAVELPIEKTFTYAIPEGLSPRVEVGKRLLVPFGKRVVTSYALSFRDESPIKDAKPVIDVLDDNPLFDTQGLSLYRWLSSYYHAPLGEVLRLIHPPELNVKTHRYFHLTTSGKEVVQKGGRVKGLDVLRAIGEGGKGLSTLKRLKGGHIYTILAYLKQKGFIEEEIKIQGGTKGKKVSVDSMGDIPSDFLLPHRPTDEQKKAIEVITEGVRSNRFSPFLLYGVTGSGKTFVYLKAVEEALNIGRKAILLVPEIALTTWLARPLLSRFQKRVAILHSGLSAGERYSQWRRIAFGEVDVVVGARSALFAPLKGLGLIIVDEEHDPSYKQEEGVRYNARDVALMMGRLFKLTVVLGSATPSIETFYNTRKGKITPLYLEKRVEDRPLPLMELVDMRGESHVLSHRLSTALRENMEKGRQSILFLNRRGFATSLICRDCGHGFMCFNCSIPLTFHKRARVLRCHYCDLTTPAPDICPRCRGYRVEQSGAGTERVEEEVKRLFPEARAIRMDRDTTRKRGAHQGILDAVGGGGVDILLGT
ncbi:MAG: primosomal protein N', partial [Deltaproteobacteria bacterium]|nr:primosomal protein N' [Deltaproteobacteria bacterium]